jgi:heterodisulfide reductase subunit A
MGMNTPEWIGIYFIHEEPDFFQGIDLHQVMEYVSQLPNVVHVEYMGVNPRLDPEVLTHQIRKAGLTGIVIAGDTPGFYKPAFTRALEMAGADPEQLHLASFRRHATSFGDPVENMKAVVACAVHAVPYGVAAVPPQADVNPDTLIIGGGVAGIQAALEIAAAGKKVILVEKTATLGGHMAMFDKTFPTLDCAACILTPKMVAVGQNQYIDTMMLSEVQEISGSAGNYKVRILKRARRVNEADCVACRLCSDVCPVSVPSEFDCGVSTRKAIYIPFPQAVPNSYTVDAENCLYVTSNGKKCGACVKKCAKEAITLEAEDELVEVSAGNIIIATGYDVLDARRIESYGYGVFPNVLTALEFERMTNASGPTGGKIVMKSKKENKRTKAEEWVFAPDGPPPKSVAIIHCVGSRDRNYNPYCSRVCCMYSLKFAHLVKEKLPDTACYEFYIDMRAYGKGYEDFFQRIQDEGVFVVRGRTAKVGEKDGQLILKGEDILGERVMELPVDMVLLAVGLVPPADTVQLADMMGIPRDDDGWFAEWDYNTDPTATERGGIHVAGFCQGPKDIPDTVAQASAVAARVLKTIVSGRAEEGVGRLSTFDIEARAKSIAAERRGRHDRQSQSQINR